MKLEFIDIRRAYYQAKARREIYVQLPPEDYERGMCGKLNKSMYIRAVVHGDDFTVLGSRKSLDWLKMKSEEKFEIKHQGRTRQRKKKKREAISDFRFDFFDAQYTIRTQSRVGLISPMWDKL